MKRSLISTILAFALCMLYVGDTPYPQKKGKATAESADIKNLILGQSPLVWQERTLHKNADPIDTHPPPLATSPLKRLYGGYMAGKGVGYPTGYTTLGTFFSTPTEYGKRAYPVVDLRGHYLNNNTWAANAGVGYRFILPSSCTILGANVFYDFRQNPHAFHNQIGVGLELLGKWISLQVNGYFPIGKNNQVTKITLDDYIGNYHLTCELNDFAYASGNAEFGTYLFQTSAISLYAGGGAYYLSGKFGNNAVGVAGRIEAQFSDIVSLAFIASHDKLFGTLYQGEITLTFPLYRLAKNQRTSVSGCGLSSRQLYQKIRRNEIIPTSVQACYIANF
ncbi:MAG: inverse autotransporter beta domain-containing protein [Verrucomicrobia bacterium]|nr:inverse autotransporter beta domain-containing protein [Verrucomicrobiota bacterium]